MGRIRSDQPGAKPIEQHKAEKSNIERREDDESRARGFQKFPMHVHGEGGLWKEVTNEDQLADAVAKGWYADIRDVPKSGPDVVPDAVHNMTVEQAKAKISKADIFELGAIEADEQSHGNRADVIALIEAAKDAAMVKAKQKQNRK